MRVEVLREAGHKEALFALGLSYGITSGMDLDSFAMGTPERAKLEKVARTLAPKDGGHNSFLELVEVWLDIRAPRYWHAERDRYRMSAQFSESTMHTLNKRPLAQEDFETPVNPYYLEYLNNLIAQKAPIQRIKNALPEGFLQRRVVKCSYKTLRNVILQRRGHRLPEWRQFCDSVMEQLVYPEWLGLPEE